MLKVIEKKRFKEKQFIEKIILLIPSGFKVEKEVKVKYGRIDVLITEYDCFLRETKKVIVEVKDGPEYKYTRKALGQILFYREAYPEAHLYICCGPIPINSEDLIVLHKYGVKDWISENPYFKNYESIFNTVILPEENTKLFADPMTEKFNKSAQEE